MPWGASEPVPLSSCDMWNRRCSFAKQKVFDTPIKQKVSEAGLEDLQTTSPKTCTNNLGNSADNFPAETNHFA